MPSRELQYRVNIDTGAARAAARNVRSAIERELRLISVGQIDTRGLQTATDQARALRNELDGAADEQERLNRNNRGGRSGGGDGGGIAGGLLAGVGAYLTLNVAKQVEATARAFAEGNTEIKRANVAFVELAGGVQQAQGRLLAIQQGAAGTVSQLGAIKIANQAASLGLAETAGQFQRLTEAARVTALISPVINDVGTAITELGLASANLSFRRLDQLGLSVTEVKDRMRELQAANADLTDSQAFLEASVDALIRKGDGLLNSQAAQASGVERFNVAINEFLDQEGAFSNAIESVYGSLADAINSLLTVTNLGSDKTVADFLDTRVQELKNQVDAIEEARQYLATEQRPGIKDLFGLGNAPDNLVGIRAAAQQGGGFDAIERDAKQELSALTVLDSAFKTANQDIIEGEQGALAYRAALRQIAVDLERSVIGYDDISDAVRNAAKEYKSFQDTLAGTSGADQVLSQYGDAQRRADERLATILDAQGSINESITKRAEKSIGTVGVEQALEALKQEKAAVEQAVQQLIDSAITDPTELNFRLAEIGASVDQFFTDLESRASGGNEISFGALDAALAQFDQGFVDFLPGLDNLRNQLIDLQTELAFTGSMTDEQAAQFDYLSGAASAVSGEAAALNAVTNELGISFLAENEAAAAVVDQMYLATAAYLNGSLSAEQYAGVISALGGQLLSYAQQAGVATDATLALVNSMGGLAGTGGFQVGQARGNAIAQRIETQQAARERATARREAEQAAKEAARLQEQAAKRAARELERGAEQARRELESALKSVPGLFGRSQVTQGQLDRANAGLPQNFADDYLRRLQDEVFNGNDWADVSIEEAKQSLRDLGIQVADDNKIAFEQFAEAWDSSVLFADEANLRFINQDAVQLQIDLQEKAKKGQENIYKLFGIAVDEAVSAASSGISGGGISTGTIPTAASLIPANGNLTAIPTLGGISTVIDVEAIQGQLNGLTITPTVDASAITLDGDLATALSPIAQQVAEQLKTSIAAEIGTTKFDGSVIAPVADGLVRAINTEFSTRGAAFRDEGAKVAGTIKTSLASAIGETEWNDAGIVAPIADGLTTAINTQFRGSTEALKREGLGVAITLRYGIAQGIATTEWGGEGIVAPVATGLITAINTQFRANTEAFKREGAGVSSSILAGLANGWATAAESGTNVASGLAGVTAAQFTLHQGAFYAIGQQPAANVLSGFASAFADTNGVSDQLVSPLLFGITNGIRANDANFQQRGATIARSMVNGFRSEFDSDTFRNTLIAAGETMGRYLEIGILAAISGGALVEAIGAQVLADIAETVEEPAP